MTIQDLARLVQSMRANQTLYFKTRSLAYLEKSKELESKVDFEISKIFPPKEESNLFNQTN